MLHYAVNVVVEIAELESRPVGSGIALADATLWDLFNRSTSQGLVGSVLAGYYRADVSRRNGEWRLQRLSVSARWVVPTPQAWGMSGDFEPRPELRPD